MSWCPDCGPADDLTLYTLTDLLANKVVPDVLALHEPVHLALGPSGAPGALVPIVCTFQEAGLS